VEPFVRTLISKEIAMKTTLSVALSAALVLSVAQAIAAPGATIGAVTYTVNEQPGLEFVGEGDRLYLSGGATCTIGAMDEPTTFYQTTYLIEQFAEQPVAYNHDSEIVTPGAPDFGTDTTFGNVGYTVPMGGQETYEAWIVIECLDPATTQIVELDTEMQYFIAD
jgi:hypothetical protein